MTRIIKLLSCILALISLACIEASAQSTINAASCSESDVQNAISHATTDGDIVKIPAGTCSWSSQMNISVSNSITIQGAGAEYATSDGASTSGTDQTIIDSTITSSVLIRITTAFGKSFRLTGIAFTGHSGSDGIIQFWGGTHSVQVDHCHFYNIDGGALLFAGNVTGVADHNLFQNTHGAFHTHNGYSWLGSSEGAPGDESWADGDHWGTSQFMFYEDNQLNGGGTDCFDGGRYVFRHNTLTTTSDSIFEHGTRTIPDRGCRAAEVYQNQFVSPTGTSPSGPTTVFANSGALLYWGNTDVGWKNLVAMENDRQMSAYGETAPPNGWGYCGSAVDGQTSPWDENTTSTGYACMDQTGRGKGDLLTGSSFPNIVNSTTGTTTWPHQALDPVYVWDNNYTPVPNDSDDAYVSPQSSLFQDNRDYYQSFGKYGEQGSFDGSKGIGQGSTVPTVSCTENVGYWDTSNNTLYRCNSSGGWDVYYKPYPYPYPTDNSSASGPDAPSSLSAMAH